MYARRTVGKSRSGSFPCSPRSLDRRHSLRLFGSSKRLQRCASTRSLSKAYAQHYQHHHSQGQYTTDSSSSEYHSADSTSPKKISLLSRLFRRSTRCGKGREQIKSFSAQFPPAEWFNSKTVHLHCVATQTNDKDTTRLQHLSQSTFYDSSECSNSHRSSSLPRRHHRRHLSSESAILISSRDHSPIRRKSPLCYSGSLPRASLTIGHPKNNKSIRQPRGSEDLEEHKSSHDSDPFSLGAPCSGPSSLESQQSTATLLSSSKRVATPYRSPRHTSRSALKSVIGKPPRDGSSRANDDVSKCAANGIPGSKSNNSITLQVTTSNTTQRNGTLGAGNTKIYVQNSPVRSVITFENDNLTENSNVYVVNKEMINGETSHSFSRHLGRPVNTNAEMQTTDTEKQDISTKIESLRISSDKANINKNCNNDVTNMNNNRKLSLQLPNNGATVGNLNYKNMLKNEDKGPVSPSVHKNVLDFDNITYQSPNKSNDDVAASAGNPLLEKNSFDSSGKIVSKLNSDSDLKQAKLYMGSGDDLIKKSSVLNSNPNLSNYYMSYQSQHTLPKNNTDINDPITAGSQPNLTLKKLEVNPKLTFKVQSNVNADRRLSLSRENTINSPDLVNFPSFNDLSFNFTSLAAQKVLKGVSINSIDTLVELNMVAAAKDKHNNCELGPVCTDFGLV